MPHIHTKPGQHDHTASAIIVRSDGTEPRLLLHRHKKLGVYMQFGGHIELDETPWQTVAHEILEESGYDFNQLQLLQPKERLKKLTGVVLHPQPVSILTHEFMPGHYHTDMLYALITPDEPAHEIDQSESNDFILLTRQQLLNLSKGQIPENLREICLFILNTCLPNWDRVPPKSYK